MSFKAAVTRTLHYARFYHTVLSPAEIRQRLISSHYYQLSKKYTQDSNIQPNPRYTHKLKIAQIFARQIKFIFPDILLLAVTGSVAAKHPHPGDDIDFLIITRPHALWLTRLRLLLFLHRRHFSFRRFNQKESANLFCFNLWLDQTNLSLPPSKRHLRNAVDLVLLKPLINQHRLYQQFLLANSWAKKYVCTPYTNLTQRHCEADVTSAEAISCLPAFGGGLLRRFAPRNDARDKKFENCKPTPPRLGLKIKNYIAFLMQYLYMLPKITTETITLHSAFFHPKRV